MMEYTITNFFAYDTLYKHQNSDFVLSGSEFLAKKNKTK